MKRFILILALLAAVLCACGDEPVEIDIASAAERMLSEVEYYEELYETDLDMAKSLLSLEDSFSYDIKMYVGSGASADMLIVAETEDSEALMQKIEVYLESQEELYASYMIFEADKISHAVKQSNDRYIIVCVTEDTETASAVAKEILK